MSRKRKTTQFDEVFDITTALPWQAGVGLAVASFIGLHYYAGLPMPELVMKNPADMLPHMLKTIARSGAGVLQYLAPMFFLGAAALSAFRRRAQRTLHREVAEDPASDALEKMSWREFEGLTAENLRQRGFRVVERGGAGPDGGVDLEAYLGKDKYLVQCKQWKTRQVGVATVRELFGVVTAERAVGGFVVASGHFTPEAKAFAEGRAIELVDARKLRKLMGGETATSPEPVASDSPAPLCPKCNSTMVLRTSKAGATKGQNFWGCSEFPKCRGMRH